MRNPALLAILNLSLRIAAGWAAAGGLWAQTAPAADVPASAPTTIATPAPAPPAAANLQAPAKGQWKELTRSQQLALEPLAPHWASLSEGQKSKWLTLSKNFANLPDYEKSTMHSRMAEWATLTPQQRSQARLNFGETNRIPQVEKKAQWEAYQSLSEEEKRKWVANQQTRVMGTALAPKPAAPDKLSHVQTPAGQLPTKGKAPGVKDVDPKTLLPAPKVTPTKADATPA